MPGGGSCELGASWEPGVSLRTLTTARLETHGLPGLVAAAGRLHSSPPAPLGPGLPPSQRDAGACSGDPTSLTPPPTTLTFCSHAGFLGPSSSMLAMPSAFAVAWNLLLPGSSLEHSLTSSLSSQVTFPDHPIQHGSLLFPILPIALPCLTFYPAPQHTDEFYCLSLCSRM